MKKWSFIKNERGEKLFFTERTNFLKDFLKNPKYF